VEENKKGEISIKEGAENLASNSGAYDLKK
jgi:hypothetical protein